jgi:hypothetical protein
MFGWTRIVTFAAVAAALAIATGVAGATSKPGSVPAAGSHMTSAGKTSTAAAGRAALLRAANLRTRAGAARYLRAIGVNPHHFVIQRGIRNYAGANCPGKGWSCTSTAHPVIQVASAGGSNTFQCATASCAVVQVSTAPSKPGPSPNTATCIKTTGLTQSCSINQSSATADNTAIVVEGQVAGAKMSGLTQTASYSAQITQRATGTANKNKACVLQTVNIDGSNGITKRGTPVAVTLNAHQSVSITQDSTHGGNTVQNATATGACDTSPTSLLTQSQTLTSNATGSGSVMQSENATDGGPNVSLDIAQNQSPGFLGNISVSGVNRAGFSQTNALTAVALTAAGPVSQTQSSPNGGLLATVNQFSHDASNISTIEAVQNETQCEHAQLPGPPSCSLTTPMSAPAAYIPVQVQYGPLRKGDGTSTQGDNPGDTFTVSQSSTQNRDNEGQGDQQNTVQADCSTSGNCHVEQTTTVDGQPPTTNIQNGQNVDTSTTCTGSSCTAPTPGITFDGSPGTAAPPSTLGTYNMTAFGPDSQPNCSDPGSTVTGVNDPAGAIGFTPSLHHDKATGPCWATWSHGYAGDVYDTVSAVDPTTATITLPSGTNAFYFYAEPNQFSVLTIQATAQNGTTSGPISVDGNGGAQYFGFYGTGGVTVASITVTTSDPQGFAVGEFGISVTPPVIL